MADAVEDQIQQPVWDGPVDEDGLPHGQGTLIYPPPPTGPDGDTKPGDQFVGNMNHGNREGKGKYIWTSIGASYDGDYSSNMKHGSGILIVPEKGRYEGSFVEDQLDGEGTYYYLNGDIYAGTWKANKKHGQGYYYFKAQHCQYVGTWHEGNFIEGKWVYNDGSMFSGSLGEVTAQAANAEQALLNQNLVAQSLLAPQLAAAQQQQQQAQAQAQAQAQQQPMYVLQNADGQYYFASSGLLQPGLFNADGTWNGGEITAAQLASLSGVAGVTASGAIQ